MDKIVAINWYGNKARHLDFILPHIPDDAMHFVDVFGGGASVLLNISRYEQETYNDLDKGIVRFFEVLKKDTSELRRKLFFTPYSFAEYREAVERKHEDLDDVEHARLLYIRTKQSYLSVDVSSWVCWSYGVANTSKLSAFMSGIMGFDKVGERMRNVNIENLPAIDLIRKHDSPDTVFYLDPPYVHDTRVRRGGYDLEMTEDDHIELGEVLNSIEARAVLSGYKNPLYDDIFKHWTRIDDKKKYSNASRRNIKSTKQPRQESLWINFA